MLSKCSVTGDRREEGRREGEEPPPGHSQEPPAGASWGQVGDGGPGSCVPFPSPRVTPTAHGVSVALVWRGGISHRPPTLLQQTVSTSQWVCGRVGLGGGLVVTTKPALEGVLPGRERPIPWGQPRGRRPGLSEAVWGACLQTAP